MEDKYDVYVCRCCPAHHGSRFIWADFCELYIEKSNNQSLSIKNEVHSLTGGIDFGIGVRLIFGTEVLYGYLNSLEAADVTAVVAQLANNYKRERLHALSPLQFQERIINGGWPQPISNIALVDDKVAYLREVTGQCLDRSDKISVAKPVFFKGSRVLVVQHRRTSRPRRSSLLSPQCICYRRRRWRKIQRILAQMLQGWEMHKAYTEILSQQVVEQALIKLNAAPCPSGNMPVVIGNAFGGVIFHEACGHLLETTSVQKKALYFGTRWAPKSRTLRSMQWMMERFKMNGALLISMMRECRYSEHSLSKMACWSISFPIKSASSKQVMRVREAVVVRAIDMRRLRAWEIPLSTRVTPRSMRWLQASTKGFTAK